MPIPLEWMGNHHLLLVRPLAILGTNIPTGRKHMVASAPHTTWAISTVRLELAVVLDEVPAETVELVIGARRAICMLPEARCCCIVALAEEDSGLVEPYAQMRFVPFVVLLVPGSVKVIPTPEELEKDEVVWRVAVRGGLETTASVSEVDAGSMWRSGSWVVRTRRHGVLARLTLADGERSVRVGPSDDHRRPDH
jgi:hypothetical protein